jgi:hypothetical protein
MKKLLFLFILLTQVAAAQSPVYKDTTFGKFGVVHPITAEPITEFEYAARKAGQWYCFDAEGRLVAPRSFDWIRSPDVEHYRTFKASQAAKGKLLAYAGDPSRSDGWYAITDRRQAIFIKSAAKRSKTGTRH